jgi:NAD(P)-dependent dehydrogenase (short-subunit alcohol dehydrogenase family)
MAKTVAVSGATGGIGEAVVEALAAARCRVLALGRSPEKLEALRSRVAEVVPVVLDLASRMDIAAAFPRIDRLHGLVHCAGVSEVAAVEASSQPLWEETFAVNVTGPAALTRVLLPALRAARGHVVFVNAAPGLHGVANWSAYTASKAALRELADSLREEEARQGLFCPCASACAIGVMQGGFPTSPRRSATPQGRQTDVASARRVRTGQRGVWVGIRITMG